MAFKIDNEISHIESEIASLESVAISIPSKFKAANSEKKKLELVLRQLRMAKFGIN